MRSFRQVGCTVLALVLLSGIPAAAARKGGSSLPIETVACGATITHSLQLAADMDCTADSSHSFVIYIGADSLILDLGGHDISMRSSHSRGIYVDGDGAAIRNGRIVLADGVSSSGIESGSYGPIAGLTVADISIVGTGVGYGVYVQDTTDVSLNRVTIDSVATGVSSNASTVTIARSTVTGYTDEGFRSNYDLRWTGSYLTAVAQAGRANMQLGFYDNGSDLYDLRYSTATGADGNSYSAGLEVDMPGSTPGFSFYKATVVGNRFTGNRTGVAFYSTYSFTYTARSIIKDNVANSNTLDGFYFWIRALNAVSVSGNQASENGDDGFEIANPGGGPSCDGSCAIDVSQNEARVNGDMGFTSAHTALPTSRNAVYRNAGLLTLAGQCFNVNCYLLKK